MNNTTSSTPVPAKVADLVARYNRAFNQFCTKQLGSHTAAAELRMNSYFAQLDKLGWTLQSGEQRFGEVTVYVAVPK